MKNLNIDPECNRIKELREKHGISQEELAEMMHIAPPSVSNWGQGKTKLTKAKLKILAKLFGVSTDYLLGKDWDDIPIQIATPSKHEFITVPKKYQGLLDRKFDMVVSLMNFFIKIHESGRLRYAELSMLDDYGNYLQYVLSSEAEKELAGEWSEEDTPQRMKPLLDDYPKGNSIQSQIGRVISNEGKPKVDYASIL